MREFMQNAKDNLSFLLVSLLIVAVTIGVTFLVEKLIKVQKDPRNRTRKIALIGVFSAISGVLMLLEVPLPFAPPFYKLDFSELPVLICAFAYGPAAGAVAEFLKILLKLLLKGTTTAFVGDLANFIVGMSLILPASILYHIRKTRKTALLGMGCGTLVMTVFGSLFNAVYLIPTFARMFGMPLEAIIGMGSAINPRITDLTGFILFCVVPFNLLKGLLVSLLTFLLYKRLSSMIHKAQNAGGES